jgi:hypothetical protein
MVMLNGQPPDFPGGDLTDRAPPTLRVVQQVILFAGQRVGSFDHPAVIACLGFLLVFTVMAGASRLPDT